MPCMPNASGSWSAIHSVVSKLHHDNVLLQESLRIKVGNGLHTDFWHDPWIGHDSLAIRFPRSFALDTVKFGSVASHFSDSGWSWLWRREHRSGAEQLQHAQLLFLLDSVSFSGEPDHWWWDKSNDGVFYTHSARKIIDSSYHASFSFKTVWCNYVPIKVNIFIWRLKLHRLATLRNLEAKGLTFDNSCCGLCDVSEESHSHLFVRCDTSYQIWCKVGRWLGISIPIWDSVDEVWSWIDSFSSHRKKKLIIMINVFSTFWNIWSLRNGIIFKDHKQWKSHVFDNIVSSGFSWLFSRLHKPKINWTDWLKDPLNSM
ncbi:uncharacterized protein [Rutidosis leptorrhynchoides]|uniref:uncharacterized protein n=1 Tax=Rutidosis leptorrhynchoides TaxID=125765 RepID=UPI003A9A219D